MKKIIILLFISMLPSSSWADGKAPKPAVDGVSYFPQKTTQIQETGLTYAHFGRSITTYSDSTNVTNYVGSLGHRRYADNLIYGMEYSYHFSLDKIRYQDYDILVGYRPVLNYRVSPYVMAGAGLSFSSGDENLGRSSGNGINYFLDAGVDLFSIDLKDFNIKLMSGLKMTHETLTGGPESSRLFTDMYLGIGFGW